MQALCFSIRHPVYTAIYLIKGEQHGISFPLTYSKHGAGNLLLFILINHCWGLGFPKRKTCIFLSERNSSCWLLWRVRMSDSSAGFITCTCPSDRCFCQAGCPKISLYSEKPHDFRVFLMLILFFPPAILLLLLQTLNCLRSSSSKEIFVSYWTRNRKSSQGHLTCNVFVSKYQRP